MNCYDFLCKWEPESLMDKNAEPEILDLEYLVWTKIFHASHSIIREMVEDLCRVNGKIENTHLRQFVFTNKFLIKDAVNELGK